MSSGFTFGQPSSSAGSSGGLFGTANTNPGTSLFGNLGTNNTNTSGGTTPSIFGTTNTTGSLFGNTNTNSSTQPPDTPASKSLFGSTTPAPSKAGNVFGQPSTTPAGQPPAGGLFGASTGAATQSSTTPTFSFGNAANTTPAVTTSTSPAPAPASLFNTKPASGGLFGAQNTSATPTSNLFGSTPAPTAQPSSTGLFGQASNSATPSAGMFSNNQTNSNTNSIFTNAASNNTKNQSTTPTFSFGPSKPAETNTTSVTTTNIFGQTAKKDETPAQSSSAKPEPPKFSFGAPATSTQPSTNLFGAPSATASTTTPQPAPTTSDLFAKPGAPASQSTTAGKPAGGFSFPSLGKSALTSEAPQATISAPTSAPSLFSPTTTTTPASSAAPAFSFGTVTSTTKPSDTTATTTTAPSTAPSLGLFANTTTTKPATSTAPTTTAAPGVTTASTAGLGASVLGTSTLGASTAGPAPPAQSRLRNKTMDEILTRWASDLTRYTKEFRAHAETIAKWDQIIVDNSTKIDQLYVKTRTCEKQTMSIEMQLSAVESQQAELDSWLSKYEQDVEEMLAKEGPQTELGGPDQERERTYKLAEKLGERLDEMGKDLQSMVEEVNAANASLSKNGKADEPITQIVKILNSHLSQLQAIDHGTQALQAKVAAAQRAASGVKYLNGSLNGGNGAAVDDFYRSYLGRR